MKLTTQDCTFDKKTRRLVYSLGHTLYPQFVIVRSTHTGKEICFVQDNQKALDNEFWDGIEMWYKPTNPLPNVEHLVLTSIY